MMRRTFGEVYFALNSLGRVLGVATLRALPLAIKGWHCFKLLETMISNSFGFQQIPSPYLKYPKYSTN